MLSILPALLPSVARAVGLSHRLMLTACLEIDCSRSWFALRNITDDKIHVEREKVRSVDLDYDMQPKMQNIQKMMQR
jgi:hypothetical protein